MEFNADLFRSLQLKKAHGPIAVISHLRISRVVTYDHVVLVREVDHSLKKGPISHGGRRIVGIIDP